MSDASLHLCKRCTHHVDTLFLDVGHCDNKVPLHHTMSGHILCFKQPHNKHHCFVHATCSWKGIREALTTSLRTCSQASASGRTVYSPAVFKDWSLPVDRGCVDPFSAKFSAGVFALISWPLFTASGPSSGGPPGWYQAEPLTSTLFSWYACARPYFTTSYPPHPGTAATRVFVCLVRWAPLRSSQKDVGMKTSSEGQVH